MTTDELRKSLGMGPNELLTNSSGAVADILAIDGEHVILGVIATGQEIRIPLNMILPEKPEEV